VNHRNPRMTFAAVHESGTGHILDIPRSRMGFRFRWKSGLAAHITSMTEFGPDSDMGGFLLRCTARRPDQWTEPKFARALGNRSEEHAQRKGKPERRVERCLARW